MASEAEERILNGRAWNDFCDQLKGLGDLITRPETPGDVENRARGYRYLTRLLRAGLEAAVDYADPQYPAFFRLADETKGVLNDNPDNYYQNCVVDGRFDYRITGTRGTVAWFSLGTKGSAEPGNMTSTGEIDSTTIEFNDDGSFELEVSSTEKPGNWLPMTEASRMIIVRQTFGDRSQEEIAILKIECLNPERVNNTLRAEELEGQLAGALGFVSNTTNLGIDWMERYRKHLNELPEDDHELLYRSGGDPNIHYYQSFWKLDPDEALLVHLDDIPECETWNLQLSNYWMESLEYRFFNVCVNKFTADYEDDGSVYIVIAGADPGARYKNWLNTTGHDQGGMLGRYVGSKNPPKKMAAKLVKLAELQAESV
ncbi:MAG: DUF1214 domain-containing protein [Myxococcota bacterium]|nr:DUF1214 domain-containing protein [Myxococcota bacterium]